MRKVALQIAAMAGILLAVCVGCRMAMRGTYVAKILVPYNVRDAAPEDIRITEETPGIVSHGAPVRRGDYMRVPIRPQKRGRTYVNVRFGRDDIEQIAGFRVGRFGTVYDYATGGFTGDYVVMIALTVFWLGVAFMVFLTLMYAYSFATGKVMSW